MRHDEIEGEWLNLAEFHAIDLFAFRLWMETPDPVSALSSGLTRSLAFYRRVAYEIKVSRSDLLRELRKPGKRATALALTHQFFFATTPGLVHRGELPAECGLVEVEGSTVNVVRPAPMRKPTRSLKTEDMVALLRARHIGSNTRKYREQARIASGLLRATETEYRRSEILLGQARMTMLREKGQLLVAGSEWSGPWPLRQERQRDTRVVVTDVNVYDGPKRNDGLDHLRVGTVYVRPVERFEQPDWLDAGDFLISFRAEAESGRLVTLPPRLAADRGICLDGAS